MASSERKRPPTWDNDTAVVDMREFLADHESTAVAEVPNLSVRQLHTRHEATPPPLERALARRKVAARHRDGVVAEELRQELDASERARTQLAAECRALRARLKRSARDTQDAFARARMQGTIDHLRESLEHAEVVLTRQRADAAASERDLQAQLDESMRTVERLSHKVAHLERERERAIERLEDVQMDRAGQRMHIAHLELSLAQRR